MSIEQLPHLETFMRAAESGSFTAAAQVLGLTQAAVSQRIRALEQSLNTSLFHRQAGHVHLTEAGLSLHAYAQRILQLHQEARQAITGQKVPLTGELTLAASSVPGEHLLPEVLAEFRRHYPHVQVKVLVADSRAVLEQVEHSRCHLGLVGGKSDNPHLEFHPFGTDELVLVVPADHAWRRRKQVTVEQLCRQPLIVREAGSSSRWCLEEALRHAGRAGERCKVALELGSNEAIKEAVLRGLGLAVLSIHAVRKEIQAGQLHGLRVAELPLVREFFVVWDRRRALPIPARRFLDHLAALPPVERRP
jgi:DNA-binding transcriptional LysR family regulator